MFSRPAEIAGWTAVFGVVVAAFITLETIGPAHPAPTPTPASAPQQEAEPHQGPPPIVSH